MINALRRALQIVLPIDNAVIRMLNQKRVGMLQRWFNREFHAIVSKWRCVEETAESCGNTMDLPIWMVWLQGEANIPASCQMYVDSVRRCNPNRDVRILGWNEAMQLLDLPKYITDGYLQATLPPALITDYIRFALLEQYGGIWMDCTLFQVKETPDVVLDKPMWSVKGLRNFTYASAMPDGLGWQSYYLASQPHALFNKVVLDLFDEYFARYKYAIDYFLVFYLAATARLVPAVRQSYDSIPNNNVRCEQLNMVLEDGKLHTAESVKKQLLSADTWFYKGNSHLRGIEQERMEMILRELVS